MGSGTTAIACMNTQRNLIGFEMDKRYYDIARTRIEGVKVRQTTLKIIKRSRV
jgi:DNA modification methylase